MVDLQPEHLKIIRTIFREHLPNCEIRIFGSRFHKTANAYSDLDIAVLGTGVIDWEKLALLKETFQYSTLPFRVDIIDWNSLQPLFAIPSKNQVTLF